MNEYALESFINFCDEFQIAEEGLNIKNIGSNLLTLINTIWEKFIGFVRKIKTAIKNKFGKEKVKPKDEIARLQKELDELKRSSSETIKNKDDQIDSLKEQRSYLVNQRNELNNNNTSKDEKIAELENDLAAMRRAENKMRRLDALILNYNEIKRVDIIRGKKHLSELESIVSEVLKNPNGEYNILEEKYYNLQMTSQEADDLKKSLDDAFEDYKGCISDVGYSTRGRFQNYYISKNIDIITSRVSILEDYKKQMEQLILKIDKLPNDCKYKSSLNNKTRNWVDTWGRDIVSCQMLINKLTSLLNGDINKVM